MFVRFRASLQWPRRSSVGLVSMLLALGVALAACGGQESQTQASPTAGARSNEPIRIGVILSLTGPLAPNSQGNREGLEFFLQQRGNQIAGRPVQLIVEDDQGNPQVGLTKAQKLVESDRVHVLTGVISSSVVLALKGYVTEQKVPLVVMQAATARLTGEDPSPYVTRVIGTFEQSMSALARWVAQNQGRKRIIVMASDYEAGYDADRAVRATAAASGSRVIQSVFIPLGARDFAPYFTQLDPSGDAIVAFFGGADAVTFTTQFKQYGLGNRYPLYAHWALTLDPLLASQGDAALGIYTIQEWSADTNIPENQQFVNAWVSRFGQPPNAWHYLGYTAGMVIEKALQATGGDASPQKLAEALRSVQVNSPSGPIQFDRSGQITPRFFIARVDRVDGRLKNVLVEPIQ